MVFDWRFLPKWDAYIGTMYSAAFGGLRQRRYFPQQPRHHRWRTVPLLENAAAGFSEIVSPLFVRVTALLFDRIDQPAGDEPAGLVFCVEEIAKAAPAEWWGPAAFGRLRARSKPPILGLGADTIRRRIACAASAPLVAVRLDLVSRRRLRELECTRSCRRQSSLGVTAGAAPVAVRKGFSPPFAA